MHGFRFYFTPLVGVLFTFRSRYYYTIGRPLVLSLGGWSPLIHTGFHVPGDTWDDYRRSIFFGYGALTRCGQPFHAARLKMLFVTSLADYGWPVGPTTPTQQRP